MSMDLRERLEELAHRAYLEREQGEAQRRKERFEEEKRVLARIFRDWGLEIPESAFVPRYYGGAEVRLDGLRFILDPHDNWGHTVALLFSCPRCGQDVVRRLPSLASVWEGLAEGLPEHECHQETRTCPLFRDPCNRADCTMSNGERCLVLDALEALCRIAESLDLEQERKEVSAHIRVLG